MRLGIFMMPLHPAHRDPAETLQEDREAIILADQLGFYDAFVGEHLTEKSENITNSFIFLATLIHAHADDQARDRHVQPLAFAPDADRGARGDVRPPRAGAASSSASAPARCASDAEALGMLAEDRNKLFAEAIDVILAIWERERAVRHRPPRQPLQGDHREDRVAEIERGEMYKPYQKPRPEIVGTVVAPFSKGVIAMGERDFHPLSANFLLQQWLPSHWANYAEGKRRVGPGAPILPTGAIARTDLRRRRRQGRAALRARGSGEPLPLLLEHAAQEDDALQAPHHLQDAAPEQDDRELTDDYMVDRLVICGTVNKVVDEILAPARGERATSASSSTPAWTGSIPRSPSARWS